MKEISLGLIITFLLTVSDGLSHSDPYGEIHPVVQACDDHFRIGFRIKSSSELGSGENYYNRTYIRNYNLQGEPLNELKEITGTPEASIFKIDRSYLEAPYDSPVGWDTWKVLDIDKRLYAIVAYRTPLNFNNWHNYPKGYQWTPTLSLFIVDKESKAVVSEHQLGDYSIVAYNFPAVSNIVVNEGTLYVVWNKSNGFRYEDRIIYTPIDPFATEKLYKRRQKEVISKKVDKTPTMVLSKYSLKTNKLETVALPFGSYKNTKISIGLAENVLCIAYHGLTEKLTVETLNLRSANRLKTRKSEQRLK